MKQKFLTSCIKCIITQENFQVQFIAILKPTSRANINTKQDKQKTIYKLYRTRKHWGDQMIKNKGGRHSNNLPANIKQINNVKIFSDQVKNLKLLQYQ